MARRLQPGALKTLSDSKLATFVTGTQKKTRFQKEKEAKEAKEAKELADAAAIYGDFVASFDGTDRDSKSFVRGGGGGHYGDGGSGASSAADSAPVRRGSKKAVSDMELLLEEMKSKRGGASSSHQKPKRAIDDFLEEIKAKQAGGAGSDSAQAARLAVDERGSFDDGDPDTTNLYVGNLAPTTTEETLNEIFAKFGEIYSVKIMWPRTDEERARKRNCGFVSFMLRADAEDARNAMDRATIEGYQIAVGWGKAIKKLSANASMLGQAGGYLKVRDDALPPGLPLELHDKMAAAMSKAKKKALARQEKASAEASGRTGPSSQGAAEVGEGPSASPAPVPFATASPPSGASASTRTRASKGRWDAPPTEAVEIADPEMGENDERVEVVPPEDGKRRALLDRLARYVSKDGAPLESIIAQRELDNPDYVCLREPKSKDGTYYRWKVYSLLMGDKEHRWRTRPFKMAVNGKFWVPPALPRMDSDSDSDDEVSRQRERQRKRDREKLRNERYKFSTGAQMEKARERAAAEKREGVFDKFDTGRARESDGGDASGRRKKDVDPKSAVGLPLREEEFSDLQRLLQNISCSRPKIKRCMGFALDYAECSGDIVDLIKESLLVDETPIPVKMGRLYLLSDILHNASAPVRHASTYRTLVQQILPEVLEHLNTIYRHPSLGRMTANSMEEKVMALLAVWERWSLYPPLFINGLEATFQRKASYMESDTPLLASGVDAAALDIEELKRQARHNGIHIDDGDDAVRLFKKVFHAQQYFRMKTQDPYGPSTALPLPSLFAEEPDKALQAMLAGTAENNYQNPLLAMSTASASNARGTWGSVGGDDENTDDEEDLDGEDLDGVAIDDEDVDGAPLDDLDGESMDMDDKAPLAPASSGQAKRRHAESESSSHPSSKKRKKSLKQPPDKKSSRFSDESDGSSSDEDRGR